MKVRSYKTPAAFKRALDQRLRTSTDSGLAFTRRRQLVVFDRFMARIVDVLGDAVILKGGLVLELRLQRARTTKDVDLRVSGAPSDILSSLQRAGRRDLGDFMVFEVRPDDRHPTIQNDAMQYEGLRFRAQCTLAGKPYGYPFGVDVAFGDPIFGEPQVILANDVLAFAGIAPPSLRVYPVETHVAEKLHAYTMPRERPNSRVKDLPDIALIATLESIDAARLADALRQTFEFRNTHPLPGRVPAPPETWVAPYEAMAREDELPWVTLAEVAAAASAFLNPILAARLEGTWSPKAQIWC